MGCTYQSSDCSFSGQITIRHMGGKDRGEAQDGNLTDINDRALFTAASCWTCFISASLRSEEVLMFPVKESMTAVVGRNQALRLLLL